MDRGATSVEEKVMSLQRFKVSIANAENSSLKTMNTDQLLDLFTSTPASRKVRQFVCLFFAFVGNVLFF